MDLRTHHLHLRAIFQVALTASLPLGCDNRPGQDAMTDAGVFLPPDRPCYGPPDPHAFDDRGAPADAAADSGACARFLGPVSPACGYEQTVIFPCGMPDEIAHLDAGFSPPENSPACRALCAGSATMNTIVAGSCGLLTALDARPLVVECGGCCFGRRTEGLAMPALTGADAGAFLAWAASLEAASVTAFERLADELTAHGAPASLAAAARASARDEIRHAAAVGALARARGATVPEARIDAPVTRTLAAMARENVVEGCVYETWAAMVAWWQADHAGAPDVAAAQRRIARDETRHAALAWSVRDWCLSRADADGAALDAAMREAVDALGASVEAPAPAALIDELGLPPRDDARRLFASLRASIWAERSPHSASATTRDSPVSARAVRQKAVSKCRSGTALLGSGPALAHVTRSTPRTSATAVGAEGLVLPSSKRKTGPRVARRVTVASSFHSSSIRRIHRETAPCCGSRPPGR